MAIKFIKDCNTQSFFFWYTVQSRYQHFLERLHLTFWGGEKKERNQRSFGESHGHYSLSPQKNIHVCIHSHSYIFSVGHGNSPSVNLRLRPLLQHLNMTQDFSSLRYFQTKSLPSYIIAYKILSCTRFQSSTSTYWNKLGIKCLFKF